VTEINLHASDAPATNPLNASTVAGLQALMSSLGPKGPAQFAALAIALGKLASGIVAAINDRSSRAKTLASNKIALSQASLQTPTVKPPNLDGDIHTVSNGLSTINTSDTAKVQSAAAASSNVRDPSALQNFDSKQIGLITDRTRKEVSELSDMLKTVNALKKAVESV
jgi:hypothetical protein